MAQAMIARKSCSAFDKLRLIEKKIEERKYTNGKHHIPDEKYISRIINLESNLGKRNN